MYDPQTLAALNEQFEANWRQRRAAQAANDYVPDTSPKLVVEPEPEPELKLTEDDLHFLNGLKIGVLA